MMEQIHFELKKELLGLKELKNVPKLPSGSLVKVESIENSTVALELLGKSMENLVCNNEYSRMAPFKAKIISYRSLFNEFKSPVDSNSNLQSPKQQVYEMSLDISSMNWDYQPGDSFGIVCKNALSLTCQLLKRLNLDPKYYLRIPAHQKIPEIIKPTDLFQKHLDLYSTPKRIFFRHLAEYTDDSEERNHLLFLSSSLGRGLFNRIRDYNCNVLEILNLFPKCNPPVALFVEYLLPFEPRYYSIVQSPRVCGKDKLYFAFNIVKFEETNNRGICTGWLEDLMLQNLLDTPIPIFPRKSLSPFRLGKNGDVILIANGTGLSPFIGFLQDLEFENRKVTLIYGHRNKFDTIYKEELEAFEKFSDRVNIYHCLSQAEERCYVQEALSKTHDKLLFESLIYICGSTAMGKGVHEKLIERKRSADSCSLEEAIGYWNSRAVELSYVRELWG